MRYVLLTAVAGLVVVILAPSAQRLWDKARNKIQSLYDDYQNSVEKEDDNK